MRRHKCTLYSNNSYKQILLTLISLEFVIISILIFLTFICFINNNIILILYYLVFVVCERVLGLTLLILLIRSYGNDNISILNIILL